jgi:hypothetical protein
MRYPKQVFVFQEFGPGCLRHTLGNFLPTADKILVGHFLEEIAGDLFCAGNLDVAF